MSDRTIKIDGFGWVCLWLFIISMNTCSLDSKLTSIKNALEPQADKTTDIERPERGEPLPFTHPVKEGK